RPQQGGQVYRCFAREHHRRRGGRHEGHGTDDGFPRVDHQPGRRRGVSRRELHVVPAAQTVRRRRQGGRPREVRMVGGDARPGPRRAARLRAAAQAARPLDRGALEEHHGRRQVGVDDGSPVAPDRLALGVAIYLTEFSPKWLRQPVAFLVELLAAIPSVVYGLWGIFVLIPFLRGYVVPPLRGVLGWTPFLQGVFYGNSLLAGGVILAIMIVPYIAAVSREVLLAVPSTQREAAPGMGATPWEPVWTAVVPYGRAGLIGAVILGLGRALGETMAVT